MTHIENIPHILQNGITHTTSEYANPDFVPIGDSSLITTRNNFILNNGYLYYLIIKLKLKIFFSNIIYI